MEQVNDSNRLSVSQDELFSNAEHDTNNGKLRKKYYNEDGTRVFVSKNLEIERRRRDKLHSRLCTLRSIVPNITNANFLNFTLTFFYISNDFNVYNIIMKIYYLLFSDAQRKYY